MPDANMTYDYLIVSMVGLSVVEKTLRSVALDRYERLMDGERTRGEFTRLQGHIELVEQGQGFRDQLELENRCFDSSCGFDDIAIEIRRKRLNPYSAEVSSLHKVLEDCQFD